MSGQDSDGWSPAAQAEADQKLAGCADTTVRLAAQYLRQHGGDPVIAGTDLALWLKANVPPSLMAAGLAALAVRVAGNGALRDR